MKIIFANRYFYPDQSATSRMLTSLAFSLAEKGVDVTVIASRHLHNNNDVKLPATEVVSGVRIVRLGTTGFGRKKLVGRAADYLTFHLSCLRWLAFNVNRNDICVVLTDPPMLSATAAPAIALRGGVMVNWIMDLFPEVAMESGMIGKNSLTGKTTLALRNWSLRRAEYNVCPIDKMARYLSQQGVPRRQLEVLNHWADGEEIAPVDPAQNRLRREWGLDGKFVVGYSGNFGRAHDFTTVMDTAEMLRGNDRIKFLFVGEGQRRGWVESEIARRKLPNTLMKPFQPRERLSESLSAADIHLVSLLPELEHCIVPSKFYGILAAARPTIFIGDTEGEVGTAVRRHGCGAAVSLGDAKGLAEWITNLSLAPARCTAMGTNASRLLRQHHSRDGSVQAWAEMLGAFAPAERYSRLSPAR